MPETVVDDGVGVGVDGVEVGVPVGVCVAHWE